MTKLSEHFDRTEFACKCRCGFDTVDAELLMVLEGIREVFGPVIILSGCRCKSHNKSVGGTKKSLHMAGKAADIITDYLPAVVYEHIRDRHPGKYGVGLYEMSMHIDVRPEHLKWGN